MGDNTNLQVKVTDGIKEKLKQIAKSKYRGCSLSQAVRWLIEDMYSTIEKEGK